MTDNPQDQFNTIVQKLADDDNEFNAEEVTFLVQVIANLDHSARLAWEMRTFALNAIQHTLVNTALATMNKCGRTDEKKRKQIVKLCEDQFTVLMNAVAAHATGLQEQPAEETDNV